METKVSYIADDKRTCHHLTNLCGKLVKQLNAPFYVLQSFGQLLLLHKKVHCLILPAYPDTDRGSLLKILGGLGQPHKPHPSAVCYKNKTGSLFNKDDVHLCSNYCSKNIRSLVQRMNATNIIEHPSCTPSYPIHKVLDS